MCLADRLALRPKEVAEVLGVSERLVREHLRELPVVRLGSAVVVPVDLLRERLRELAQVEGSMTKEAADEILTALDLKR